MTSTTETGTGSLTGRPRIDRAIDRICDEGCRAVTRYIARLKNGEDHPHWRHLDIEERRILLRELESVMAVYGGCCRIDS